MLRVDEKLMESAKALSPGWSFTSQRDTDPEHAASAAMETVLRWDMGWPSQSPESGFHPVGPGAPDLHSDLVNYKD